MMGLIMVSSVMALPVVSTGNSRDAINATIPAHPYSHIPSVISIPSAANVVLIPAVRPNAMAPPRAVALK